MLRILRCGAMWCSVFDVVRCGAMWVWRTGARAGRKRCEFHWVSEGRGSEPHACMPNTFTSHSQHPPPDPEQRLTQKISRDGGVNGFWPGGLSRRIHLVEMMAWVPWIGEPIKVGWKPQSPHRPHCIIGAAIIGTPILSSITGPSNSFSCS